MNELRDSVAYHNPPGPGIGVRHQRDNRKWQSHLPCRVCDGCHVDAIKELHEVDLGRGGVLPT